MTDNLAWSASCMVSSLTLCYEQILTGESQYTERPFRCIAETRQRFAILLLDMDLLAHASKPCDVQFQHQGFGTLLMEEAERIARDEHGSKKLAVISGVGVRDYYARLGYK